MALPNLLSFIPRFPKAQRTAFNEYRPEHLVVSHKKINRLLEEELGVYGANRAISRAELLHLLTNGPRVDLRIWQEGLRAEAIRTVNGFSYNRNTVVVTEIAFQPHYLVDVVAPSDEDDDDFVPSPLPTDEDV